MNVLRSCAAVIVTKIVIRLIYADYTTLPTDQLGTGDLMNAVRVLQRAEDFVSSQV